MRATRLRTAVITALRLVGERAPTLALGHLGRGGGVGLGAFFFVLVVALQCGWLAVCLMFAWSLSKA